MGAGESEGSGQERQPLGIVESAGAGKRSAPDSSCQPMAVSIAGVSTACSRDALRSSAEAVRKSLGPE